MADRLITASQSLAALGFPIAPQVRPRTIMIGHSFAVNESGAFTDGDGSAAKANYATGSFEWARAYSMGALAPLQVGDNLATGGSLSTAHVTQSATAIGLLQAGGIVWCQTGTNDMSSLAAVGTCKTNVQAIYANTSSIRALLVLFTLLPRGIHTVQQRRWAANYNSWLRAWAATRPYVVVVDVARFFTDFATVNGDPIGAAGATTETEASLGYNVLLYDLTHPAHQGASVMGKMAWSLISRHVLAYWPGLNSPIDTATIDNPTGALNANGTFSGTGGGATNLAAGSVVAAGYNLANDNAAMTVTASKVTNPYGLVGAGQRVQVASSTGTAGFATIRMYEEFTGAAAGTVIDAAEYLQINASTGLYGVSLQVIDYQTTPFAKVASGFPRITSGKSYYLATGIAGQDLCLEPPKLTVSPGSTKIRFQTVIYVDPGSATVDVTFAAAAARATA